MPIRTYIIHNFWWKLFSLLLATFTWMTIQASFQQHQSMIDAPIDTTSKRTFSAVPISILSSVYNTNRYKIDPVVVEVEVTGTEDALAKLNPRDVRVFVDAGVVGDVKLFRKQLQTQVPQGLSVTSLSLTAVNVERVTAAK